MCRLKPTLGIPHPARSQSSEALTTPDPAGQTAEDNKAPLAPARTCPLHAGTLATRSPLPRSRPAGTREIQTRSPEPAPSPSRGLPHLVIPGRVAPQHLAPHGHLEGPVGQLRLRRLLFPPPAAHPPVAPPDPGLGRAGRARRSRVWDGGSQRAGRRQSKQ